MSLPSKCRFYKEGTKFATIFCNIGLFYREDLVPRIVAESIQTYEDVMKEDSPLWDTVVLYEQTFTRAKLHEMTR